jgi:hypothetical protein
MEVAMRLGFHRDQATAWIDEYVAAWNDHDADAVADSDLRNQLRDTSIEVAFS